MKTTMGNGKKRKCNRCLLKMEQKISSPGSGRLFGPSERSKTENWEEGVCFINKFLQLSQGIERGH